MNTLEKFIGKFPTFIVIASLALGFSFTSCEKDDDKMEEESTIISKAKETADLSTLVTAIEAAGIAGVLEGDGPFTVFAPVNSAFAKIAAEDLAAVLADKEMLTGILTYHVVSGKVMSSDLSDGQVVKTLNTSHDLTVSINGSSVMINGVASVTKADIEVDNGVIHLIDAVLVPQTEEPDPEPTQSIAEIATSNDAFSTLVSILSLDELSDILAAASNANSDLTVFAPTNDAFSALLTALGKSSLDEINPQTLKDIVLYHIVSSSVTSDMLSNGDVATLLDNETLSVDLTNGVMINNASVTTADIKATNGVVHVVDKVLIPSYIANALGTVAEPVVINSEFSTLYAALNKAELVNTIATTENITVFAPNNDAFAKAGITSLEGLSKDDLTPILTYHVIGAKVMSSQLPASGMAEALNGENLYFGYLTNSVLINGTTKITGIDLDYSNGVIHTIDMTLTPPANDIVDVVKYNAEMSEGAQFTVLYSLLASDDYSDILAAINGSDNLTVFAPTDAAFQAIESTIATLSVDQIKEVLKYHVVANRVFSTDLQDQMMPEMLNGQKVTVNITGSDVSISDQSGGDDANVIEVNVNSANGVIHIIDKVLIPQL
jgi:transforming growth factor-beta-induced protein